MKKVFFFASFFTVLFLTAQVENENFKIEKGSKYLGGSISFNFSNSENNSSNGSVESNNTYLGFAPKLGYAVKDNFIVGLGITSIYSKNNLDYPALNSSESENTSTSIGVLPFIRGYKSLGSRLAIYLQAEINYSKNWRNNKTSNSPEYKSDGRSVFIGFRPGISFLISNKLALEAGIGSLGYSSSKTEEENQFNENKNDSFNFSLSSSDLLFGLAYYF
ncbi:outer membrane protein with beta-barrel domain [Maribacter vaceletii]|uniref:Outer membrane protein with beta-barrel domain n=1 Tax=Maribacter vaceletii TaxID=1206816 RepID=A0A495E885_9FLAO|nr:outer membrane beta-barrel protein [Maribacter vaceletii]RKR12861.1 outer membrane protein with beta-barrel domain [Maribacter vaceletii]